MRATNGLVWSIALKGITRYVAEALKLSCEAREEMTGIYGYTVIAKVLDLIYANVT